MLLYMSVFVPPLVGVAGIQQEQYGTIAVSAHNFKVNGFLVDLLSHDVIFSKIMFLRDYMYQKH